MKRLLTLVLIATLMLSCLGLSAVAEEDKIVVNFWVNRGAGTQWDRLAQSIETFNSTIGAEEGIEVVATHQGGYNDVVTKTLAAIVAGEQPQLVHIERSNGTPVLWDEGVLVDLTSYIEASEIVDMDNFLEAFTSFSYSPDGEIISLPYTRSTWVLYYNKTMWDEAGITELPSTWDELAEVCSQLTVVNEKGETEVAGFSMWYDFSTVAAWLHSLGGTMFSEDGTVATALEDGSLETFLTKWVEALDAGWCVPYPTSNTATTLQTDFMQGRLACYLNSVGGLGNHMVGAAEAGFELGVAPVVSFGEELVTPVTGGNMAMIEAGNSQEQLDAAWKFMEFLCTDEQVALEAQQTGYLPTTKTVAESEEMKAFWAEKPGFKVAYDAVIERGYDLPFSIYKSAFTSACSAPVSMVIQERSMTPAEAIEELKIAAESIFP